jgi:HCOMODA/2-hydroxy-3-carboxy-muconic semialdehyde decarboxylase
VSQVKLQPMFHNAAFLAAGVPVWDIRGEFGETDMLVRDPTANRWRKCSATNLSS